MASKLKRIWAILMNKEEPQRKVKLFAAGMPWTEEAKAELADCFRAGFDLEKLCLKLGRTPNAIVTQLQRQNLLMEGLPGHRGYCIAMVPVWTTFEEIKKIGQMMKDQSE